MEKHLSMDEEFLSMINEIVEKNIDNEKFSVQDLADKAGLSRSMLHRKLKKLTGKSSIELITEIRLAKARELLEKDVATASEVAYMVGYSEPNYFYKVFKKYYNISPGELKKIGTGKKLPKKNLLPAVLKVSIVFFIILFLFFIFKPSSNQKPEVEKSIAVLPFIDSSPDEGNEYIINGLMEEITNKLQIVGELKVKSRIDSEKYKDSKLGVGKIAKELNVNYILAGSGQVIGNKIKLTAQLIDASTGNNLWSGPFVKEVSDDNIFELQEDIAFSIAAELEAKLTTSEETQLQEIPTKNLIAYNHFLRGLDYDNLRISTAAISTADESYENRLKAQEQFETALKLDSSFVRPYIHLAALYIHRVKYFSKPEHYFSLLDSGLVLLKSASVYADSKAKEITWEKAMIFDLTGSYYLKKGEKEIAFEYFDKHDEFIQKQLDAYKIFATKALRYFYLEDYYNTIENALKYIKLKPTNEELPMDILKALYAAFNNTGFRQKAMEYAEKRLFLTGDSLTYYINLFHIEESIGDFESAQKYLEKAHNFDEGYDWCLFLFLGNSILLRNFEIEYIDEIEKRYDVLPDHIYTELFLGITYMKNEMQEKADKHFEILKNRLIEQIEFNLPEAQVYWSYFNLASIYSLKNEKKKALANLNEFLNRKSINLFGITLLRESPFFDNIREEPEFQEIYSNAMNKYQKERERVGELLKEFGAIE